jgi:hypothetical protein
MNVDWPCPDHLKLTPIVYHIQCRYAEHNITADDHTHLRGATWTDGGNERSLAGAGLDDAEHNVAWLERDMEK